MFSNDQFDTNFEARLRKLDRIVEETVKKQDELAESSFDNRTKEKKSAEEISYILPLSERHYLITKGEIGTSQNMSEFAKLMNLLVEKVISGFSREKRSDIDKKLSDRWNKLRSRLQDGTNFLFYVIYRDSGTSENDEIKKQLHVHVAISGSGESGKQHYLDELNLCQQVLKTDIENLEVTGYDIKGIFVPFSKEDGRTTTKASAKSFKQFEGVLAKRSDTFIKRSLMTNLLQGPIKINYHTEKTLLSNIMEDWPTLDSDFTIARKHREKIKEKMGQYKINKQYNYSSGLRLDNPGSSVIEDFEDSDEFDEMRLKYKESLGKLWKRFERIGILNLLKYRAHCSEDNLIDYLMVRSDILREKGTHYIFSVKMSENGKEAEPKRNFSNKGSKAISIRPPCSFCMIHFPLKFAAIAQHQAGLPHSAFGRRNSEAMRMRLNKISFADKLSYLRNFEQHKIDLQFLKSCENFRDGLNRNCPSDWSKVFDCWCLRKELFFSCWRNTLSYSSSMAWNDPRDTFDRIICEAAKFGKTMTIKLLDDKKIPINSGYDDEKRNKYLNAAIENNHAETVEMIIKVEQEKAELVLHGYERKSSALHFAASYPRRDIFENIWKALGNVRSLDETLIWELLDLAVCFADFEMVEYIYKIWENSPGYCETSSQKHLSRELSILNSAGMRGDYKICDYLVTKTRFSDAIMQPTPFLYAIRTSHASVAKLLFDKMTKSWILIDLYLRHAPHNIPS
ncbi:hypothetical protein QAD02_005770 [Eretmocerus hayati]|uniref:Uncharacterized protein n=1 Tax=Eretmocerus hayati TaxID=131215 RepID=A0ACC2NUI2_9HYME|nr:hypothetical protein QAD02_005770 [Eretmocerus hayati]